MKRTRKMRKWESRSKIKQKQQTDSGERDADSCHDFLLFTNRPPCLRPFKLEPHVIPGAFLSFVHFNLQKNIRYRRSLRSLRDMRGMSQYSSPGIQMCFVMDMNLGLCLFVCMSVCLSVWLFIILPTCLLVYLFIHIGLYIFIYLNHNLPVYIPIHLCICVSIYIKYVSPYFFPYVWS